jgi:hypothetical protein
MRRRCGGEPGNRLARFVRHVNADGVTDLAGLVVSCGRTRHGNEPVAEHARGARRSTDRNRSTRCCACCGERGAPQDALSAAPSHARANDQSQNSAARFDGHMTLRGGLIDICLDAGVTLFDTADVYSNGASEEILGAAIKGRRDKVLISTKTSLPMGDGPHDSGSSRHRLLGAVDASLRRLGTDYVDLLQLHAFDAGTPIEEVLYTLDVIVRAGKVRYVGISNFSGWQLMKSLGMAERHGWPRYVAHQVYYSLVGREYEWELMPVGLDQGVGGMIWSPLGWGRLTGKIRRGRPLPEGSRLRETA